MDVLLAANFNGQIRGRDYFKYKSSVNRLMNLKNITSKQVSLCEEITN